MPLKAEDLPLEGPLDDPEYDSHDDFSGLALGAEPRPTVYNILCDREGLNGPLSGELPDPHLHTHSRVRSLGDHAMLPLEKPPRLLPDEPFPPYAFVPGLTPHPVSDPRGHRYGAPPELPERLDPDRWYESRCYLRGLDLFNHGYYWESHVALEQLWLGAGRSGDLAQFLKGLIKLAAAGVKHNAGQPEGVRSHACRARQLWGEVAQSLGGDTSTFVGFPLGELIAVAEEICRSGWPCLSPTLSPNRQ